MDGHSQGQNQSQRVVLIHDASGGVRLKAVKWVLDGFLLKEGDAFTFVSVVHQILHPMGYNIRVDNSMFGGANQRAIDDEVAKKKKEYDDNLQLTEISNLYQTRKVDFKIELVTGPIPKNAAVDASKKCNATWVILDRRMKKEKKHFLEKLSCGISTMKDNDDIVDIRGPRRKQQTLIPYEKMLPVDNTISTRKAHDDQDLLSIEFGSSCNNQDVKIKDLSMLIEKTTEEQDNSPINQVPMLEEKVKLDTMLTTEEVNRNVEIDGQSQRSFDEEVNYGFGGTISQFHTPLAATLHTPYLFRHPSLYQPNPANTKMADKKPASRTPAGDDDSSSDSEETFPEKSVPSQVPNPVNSNRLGQPDDDIDDSADAYFKKVTQVLESEEYKKLEESEEVNDVDNIEDLYDFPPDPENWKEEDLREIWADAPPFLMKPGWDPNWVDKDELEIINEEIREGRDPPIAPFYVPYRKHYPVIPHNHYDIRNAKSVIEELDRIEEFLTWHSFVFADGSTYEGTVWDDLAHGKGVYEAEQGLVRYEGEWLQNNPEGHGVLEVDIPTDEPVPGSELEAKMRAEGHIFKRDFMSPDDKEWLEKDIEDCVRFSRGRREIPFYENEEWVRQFGEKPEKGRYRYAGQWKHGRMHGCGVFELNERTTYGRFYFGEFLEEDHGCDVDVSALHSGIAEVAAAKARMFVNKPDGMVREQRGPYSDPQHPYFYEGEDMWMAPGFINQFFEVPDYWKAYMEDVDEERQMWINSFYKAPLRLPMPAELEYWWENDESPEFILLNKEPEPDLEDPSKLVYTEDPVILHTPTGRIINYVDDEEHGIRLFWQPPLKDGEEVDPSKVEFLPLGDEELFERDDRNVLEHMLTSAQDKCKVMLENLEKRTEEKKNESDAKLKLIETEIEIVEAESELKEIIKEMDDELKRLEKEEEKKMEMEMELEAEDADADEDEPVEKSEEVSRVEVKVDEVREDDVKEDKVDVDDNNDDDDVDADDDDEEEDNDDEYTPPSFGSVMNDQNSKNGGRSSPFAASSMQFGSSGLTSMVPSQLQRLFVAWKESKLGKKSSLSSRVLADQLTRKSSIRFERTFDQGLTLRAHHKVNKYITRSTLGIPFKQKASAHLQRNTSEHKTQSLTWPCIRPNEDSSILSLHVPV
ncbi:hypothetical protein L1987_36430 [Smallanthus sonchifolius]|uniref:Uncharacterized protein n=1 Tax=Smallanthus sonchifolius TaxID=185202 RepID=A0ACB9HD50_9ASTR|nr:hypothetical protein L1987_36430 [Smallanthus sonchifolius]